MAKEGNKFVLPSPKFQDEVKKSLDSYNRHLNPHFSTPNGMLLPRDKQPPPMYGPRGSTVPPQYLGNPRKRSAQSAFPGSAQNVRPFQQNAQNIVRQPFRGGPRAYGASQNNGVDKEVNPELLRLDWKLWCEGCDVNCRSEEEYQSHIANHVPCSVSECKFVGHPMIMQRHIKKTHNSEKSSKQLGPAPCREEIEQWREERRKRFPTRDNVVLRQQAQEERLKRGERITENKNRFPHRHEERNFQRENGSKLDQKHPQQSKVSKRQRKRKRNKGLVQEPIVQQASSDRIPFRGTSLLWKHTYQMNNALGMLGEYGTDSEETSTEEENEVDVAKEVHLLTKEIVLLSKTPKSNESLSEGEIVDEENVADESLDPPTLDAIAVKSNEVETGVRMLKFDATFNVEKDESKKRESSKDKMPKDISQIKAHSKEKHDHSQHSKEKKYEKNVPIARQGRKDKKWLLDYSKLRRTSQNTMLEKLLDSDIRHERNILLQCVRHVVMNNFFGIGQPKEENSSTTQQLAAEENPSQTVDEIK